MCSLRSSLILDDDESDGRSSELEFHFVYERRSRGEIGNWALVTNFE